MIKFRTEPKFDDIQAVKEIAESTGFFHDHEIVVAVELIEERMKDGESSGYEFIFADDEASGKTIGYICYGLIPCTKTSYDLYWIVVDKNFSNCGVGSKLMKMFEDKIIELGGKGIYVETSSTEKYLPTRRFYEKHNYILEAEFADFYDVGDNKCMFVKRF